MTTYHQKSEAAGQMCLPFADEVREQALAALNAMTSDSEKFLVTIKESAGSVLVKIDQALLVMRGLDRELLDVAVVREDINACGTSDDAIDVLVGMGFECLHRTKPVCQ